MRNTSAIEKLIPSVINALFVLIFSLPFYFLFGLSFKWKLITILIFYILQVLDTHENINFRCFGMRVFNTIWAKKYSRFQINLYSVLYTLSFSTLFFYIYFPLDLFLINIFFLQLPTVLISGTTLHGFLSGGLRTQVKES